MISNLDTSLPNVLELKDIGQSYNQGQSWIIKGLNLVIENKPNRGQFIAILGMSGSGKSTILRYIAGLQKPTEGQVIINQEEIGDKNKVGMVFQQYSSLPWMTVLDNVSLALRYKGVDKKERDEKAMVILNKVGLKDHALKFAQYPTLSGGQLQRVAIARSLLANQDMLLMDEPFGALDVKTRLSMQDMLVDLWHQFQSTIIFVTHDISEAVYLADEIYILKSSPSHFVRRIEVDLPLERNRLTKRDAHYTELVHYVEDEMMEVSKG